MATVNVVDMVDDLLVAENKESNEKRKVLKAGICHSPSEASLKDEKGVQGKCLRALWYSHKGFEPSDPPDASSLGKMWMGNVIHDAIAKRLEKSYTTEAETSLEMKVEGLEYPIKGTPDNILTINGERVGLEVKTAFGQGMTNKVTGVKYAGPKAEWILQVHCYMALTGLRSWTIYTVARDSWFRIQHVIEWNQSIFDGIVARWKELEVFLKGETEPERDYTEKDWQCKYCAHSTTCYGKKINLKKEE